MKEQKQQVTSGTPLINDGQIVSLGPLSCFISEVNRERIKTAGFMVGFSAAGVLIPFGSVLIGNAIAPFPGDINGVYEATGIVVSVVSPTAGIFAGITRHCWLASRQASQQAPGLA